MDLTFIHAFKFNKVQQENTKKRREQWSTTFPNKPPQITSFCRQQLSDPVQHFNMAEKGNPKKRKLELQTIEVKYKAIKAVEDGKSRKEVCEEFQLKRNTLSGWVTKAKTIKEQYESSTIHNKCKRMRLAKNPDLEKAVFLWYCDLIKKDPTLPIGRDVITTKAELFAKELGITNFVPSNGWFTRFKQRYVIGTERSAINFSHFYQLSCSGTLFFSFF